MLWCPLSSAVYIYMPALQDFSAEPITDPGDGNTSSVVSVPESDEVDMRPETAEGAVRISYYGRTVVDVHKLLKSARVRAILRRMGEPAKKPPKRLLTPTHSPAE